jgi:two-component system LytT family sensor kinase
VTEDRAVPPVRPTRVWVYAFAVVVPLFLVLALVNQAGRRMAGLPPTMNPVALTALDWTLWVLLAPAVVWLARRFQISRDSWPRRTAQHVAIGIVVATAQLVAYTLFARLIVAGSLTIPERSLVSGIIANVANGLPLALPLYLVLVFATTVADAANRLQRIALEESRLREMLGRARLDALQSQLRPHFLANTLNTVLVLIRGHETEEAAAVVESLGELLNRSLDGEADNEVSLADELDLVRSYVSIERVRFGDRLRLETDVSPDTLACSVPNMLLLPLVENAVTHVGESPRDLTIRIAARASETDLRVEVSDNGPGVSDHGRKGHGIGLGNTRRRLEQLYGDAGTLTLEPHDGEGVRVLVRVPRRLAEPKRTHTPGAAALASHAEARS